MPNIIPNAVLHDPRPIEEKSKDYLHEQLYSGLPVTWVEKTQWKLQPQRFQDGSYSCVAQSHDTALGVFIKKPLSAGIYQLRIAGKGTQGMYPQNCGDILYNQGTILEEVVPSQNMNDAEMDSIQLPSFLNVKATGYRTIQNPKDIELIAQAIQAYGQCPIVFDSNAEEWIVTPIYLGTPTTFGHSICAIDFGLVNGVKTLVCMDSAGQWSSPTGIRFITENYLIQRCRGAMYYLGAKFVTPTPSSATVIVQDTSKPIEPVIHPVAPTTTPQVIITPPSIEATKPSWFLSFIYSIFKAIFFWSK